MAQEEIVLGAGCFWGVQRTFSQIEGVKDTFVGYSGGHSENPTYSQVCSGATNHAEVVQVIFDNEVVSLDEVLDVFWSCHDPSSLNRQGPDVGTQYRSCIYYTESGQKEIIDQSIKVMQACGKYQKIVTEIKPLESFYMAENYHQHYFGRN